MVCLVKAMVFPVVMYGCESWTIKKAECGRIDALEKTPESPLDCKEIKPVNPNGNKSWIFFWRTDVEAETPIVWPPDVKNWLIWKDPVSGKEWRQEETVMTEDEMVRWHQRLNGHEFEQALGVCDGQRSLACCSPWGHQLSDMTEWLKYREYSQFSCSVMSNTLRPHELQHAGPPCPSPTPRVHPNLCPLSRWCHPTISSSVVPFSSCPQSFPESGSFQMSQLFASGSQSTVVSASTSVLPMNT